MPVAPIASPIMNLEKVFCRLKAIRPAMKSDTFKLRTFGILQMYFKLMTKDKMVIKKWLVLVVLICTTGLGYSQLPGVIYKSNIQSVRFHMHGDQFSLPVYNINSGDQLELNFDDLDGNVKSYYYSFQLCDYNWEPVDINTFNYLKGFTQQRISQYRYASIALTRYTHYQAPDMSSR